MLITREFQAVIPPLYFTRVRLQVMDGPTFHGLEHSLFAERYWERAAHFSVLIPLWPHGERPISWEHWSGDGATGHPAKEWGLSIALVGFRRFAMDQAWPVQLEGHLRGVLFGDNFGAVGEPRITVHYHPARHIGYLEMPRESYCAAVERVLSL